MANDDYIYLNLFIMGAMGYESLIRMVYHCAKGGSKGADANIYRNMETTERFLTDVNWKRTEAEKKIQPQNRIY